jgi:desulfoferrodoxin-like iron-binding protein
LYCRTNTGWEGSPVPRFRSGKIVVPIPVNYIRGKNPMVNVSKEGQVFRCEICGNVVVVREAGGGELICCGEPMQLEGA